MNEETERAQYNIIRDPQRETSSYALSMLMLLFWEKERKLSLFRFVFFHHCHSVIFLFLFLTVLWFCRDVLRSPLMTSYSLSGHFLFLFDFSSFSFAGVYPFPSLTSSEYSLEYFTCMNGMKSASENE